MFPRAPDVEVFGPTTLFAGRPVEIEIVVTAELATKIDYVDTRIVGHQGWRVGSGKHAVTMRARYPELVARLCGEGELPAGTSRFRARFELPRDMPPSHRLAPAWAWLEVHVRVAIPWWPDGKYKFTLPVRVPPPPDVARRPLATVSSAAADKPRLELSLASTRLVAGETVVGSVAVFHLDDRKPREVEVTLVPSLRLYKGGRYRDRRGATLSVYVTIPAGGAGSSVPFRFVVPRDITPSFRAATHDLAWWLVAKSGSFFGGKVAVDVPLEICDASTAALTEKLRTAPRLTDERITRAFEQFASAHGWRLATDEDEHDQLVIEREAGDAVLRIGYAYRGEAGAFLVARVAHPWLGLDLDVTPSSAVRELFTSDIEIDLAAWDRTHHVTARSAAQAAPFLRAAVPAVMTAVEALGALRWWSDDELVLERQVAGVAESDLVRTSQLLEHLAASITAAPIAPPPGLDVDLDAWHALAARLAGRVTRGDLTIEGKLDQLPVDVVVEFDEARPMRVRARVGDPLRTGNAEPVTEQERAEWPADFAELRVVDGVASAALAIAEPGKTPFIDVPRVRELVAALRALLARRQPSGGPFR